LGVRWLGVGVKGVGLVVLSSVGAESASHQHLSRRRHSSLHTASEGAVAVAFAGGGGGRWRGMGLRRGVDGGT